MCFMDYNFFPILFFLGWNIFIAKQFTPSIYRYGFVRFDNKDSSIAFRQTTLSKKELFYETQSNLNAGNKLQSQWPIFPYQEYGRPKWPGTCLKSIVNDTESNQNHNLDSFYPSKIEQLFNFYRLTGEYKDVSSKSSWKNVSSNHHNNINYQKHAIFSVNYLQYKHSQNQKRSFSAKLPLKPIFHISINNSTLMDVLPYLSFYRKTPKIDNANYNSSIYYINQILTFFTSRPLTKKTRQWPSGKQHQNKTFYFSKNRFNKCLVEKSNVFLIKNQIQKHRNGGLDGDDLEKKRITFLSQTSIQKIYSLSKFQISLCFSSAI